MFHETFSFRFGFSNAVIARIYHKELKTNVSIPSLLITEFECFCKFFQKVMLRTGWPVDAGTGGTQPTKASTILQTQLKQLEGLNQQNKVGIYCFSNI